MSRILVKLGAAIALGGGLFALIAGVAYVLFALVIPPWAILTLPLFSTIGLPIFAVGAAIALWGLAPES